MKDFSAYVDFTHRSSLEELAEILSDSIFGGIPFTGSGDGIWDEVPALRLERDFLGLRIELGGGPDNGYTIQLEPSDLPEESSKDLYAADEVGDLSWYLRFVLGRVDGIVVSPGPR